MSALFRHSNNMGRKPIGRQAMSNAERQARWREQHPEEATVTVLKARVAELEAENKKLKAQLARAQAKLKALAAGN